MKTQRITTDDIGRVRKKVVSPSPPVVVNADVIPTVMTPPVFMPQLRGDVKDNARKTVAYISLHARKKIRQIEKARIAARGWENPRGRKKPFSDVVSDGAWRGERAFIVGGGPSLRDFDFSRLRGQGRIIAVNRAFEFVPFADVMVSMDNRFYRWIMKDELPGIKERYQNFRGHRVWLDLMNYHYGPEVLYIKGISRFGVSASLKSGIYHSNNSGFCALQIAVVLGASPIYLLGFDMVTGNASHFHTGYPIQSPPSVSARFRTGFEHIADELRRKDVDVVNLNPASGLRCFRFETFEDVVRASEPVAPVVGLASQTETPSDTSRAFPDVRLDAENVATIEVNP